LPINVKSESFPQWSEVLDRLDAYKASMLEEAGAELQDNTVVVSGSDVLQYFFDNEDNKAALIQAVNEASGKNYNVIFKQNSVNSDVIDEEKPQEPPKQESLKIEQFLADVESAGVQMKLT